MKKLELPAIFIEFKTEDKSKLKNVLVKNGIQYDQTVEGIELLDHPAHTMHYH